jgi:branched-chain amino acid transport system substrate-binding protein
MGGSLMKNKTATFRMKMAGVAFSMALVATGVVGFSSSPGSAAAKKTTKFATPFKIAGFYDIAGEDPYTANDENTITLMAVAYLNAHGGIGGRPVEFKRFETTYDPSTAITGYLQALAWHPSVIIGIDNTNVLVPLENKLAKSAIPIMTMQTDPTLENLKQPNSIFAMRGPTWTAAGATTAWMLKNFKAKSVGLICVDATYGTTACDQDEAAIAAAGATTVARVQSQITSTDESTQAEAMLGSQIVDDEGYPGVIQLDLQAMDAEGLTVPISAGGSIAYATGGLDASQLNQLYGYADCLPVDFTSALGKTVESQFLAKFGSPLGGYTAHFWDAVLMAGQAAKDADSPAPSAIKKELRTMTYKGICSTYHAGSYQNMVNSVEVIHATSATTFSVVANVPLPNK